MKIIQILVLSLVFSGQLLAEGPCRVGLLLPLTGEYASLGRECQQGIDTAKARHSDFGQVVKYYLGDSKATGRDSVAEVKKLIFANQVEAIQLIRSPVGMSVNPISMQEQVPLLGAVGHADFLDNPFAYRFWSSVELEAGALAKHALNNQHQKIAIISTEDDWLLSFRKAFVDRYLKGESQIVFDDTVTSNYTDYKTIISKIRASQPDAVFLNLGISNLTTFIKRAREFGLTQKFYSVFWVKSPEVMDNLDGRYLEDISFVEIKTTEPNFYQQFKKLYVEAEPTAPVVTCYVQTEAAYQACQYKHQHQSSYADALANLRQISTFDASLMVVAREVQYHISYKQINADKTIRELPEASL